MIAKKSNEKMIAKKSRERGSFGHRSRSLASHRSQLTTLGNSSLEVKSAQVDCEYVKPVQARRNSPWKLLAARSST